MCDVLFDLSTLRHVREACVRLCRTSARVIGRGRFQLWRCRGSLLDPTHSGTLSTVRQATVEGAAASCQGDGKSASRRTQSRIPEGEDGYVISLVRRGRHVHKELHYLGQRHLITGVGYLLYDWMGPQRPGVTFYDSVCTRCWPAKHSLECESTSSDPDESDHP